jgi:hypothetical protein
MAALIDEFRQEEFFGQDDAGELTATVDPTELQQAALRALATAQQLAASSASQPLCRFEE